MHEWSQDLQHGGTRSSNIVEGKGGEKKVQAILKLWKLSFIILYSEKRVDIDIIYSIEVMHNVLSLRIVL